MRLCFCLNYILGAFIYDKTSNYLILVTNFLSTTDSIQSLQLVLFIVARIHTCVLVY